MNTPETKDAIAFFGRDHIVFCHAAFSVIPAELPPFVTTFQIVSGTLLYSRHQRCSPSPIGSLGVFGNSRSSEMEDFIRREYISTLNYGTGGSHRMCIRSRGDGECAFQTTESVVC